MRKIFNLMLVAMLAIGISSCSNDADDGAGVPDQQGKTYSNNIDWSVFEQLGPEVVNELKQLVDGPQTRAVGDLTMTVTPDRSDVYGIGMDVNVRITKNKQDAWPTEIVARIVEHPNMNHAILRAATDEFTGDTWEFPWTIPAFYSSTPTDTRVLIYQFSVDGGATWRNPKIVLQYALVADFATDLTRVYTNSRIPQSGGEINVYQAEMMDKEVTFRIRSLDDPSYFLAEDLVFPANVDMAEDKFIIKANLLENNVIPFVIEYRIDGMEADEYIEFERGIQESGLIFQVDDVLLSGSQWIGELGEMRELELVVKHAVGNEIDVKIVPYGHSAYTAAYEIVTKAYKVHSEDPLLNDWKIRVQFPAARGESFTIGEPESGWHVNFADDLKAGASGAGLWAVEYKNANNEWVTLNNFLQRAYFIGVKNDAQPLYIEGGEWKVRTQGTWPEGTVKFRPTFKDNQGVWHPGAEVLINTMSTAFEYWVWTPAMLIPENSLGYRLQWKLEYWIDDIGEWRTWDLFNEPGFPEYGWEGRTNILLQYHF